MHFEEASLQQQHLQIAAVTHHAFPQYLHSPATVRVPQEVGWEEAAETLSEI